MVTKETYHSVKKDLTSLSLSLSLKGEFSGIIEWIPSPYQGGWEGNVCVEACVSTGVCPAKFVGVTGFESGTGNYSQKKALC
jgi:hypothetical protein